MVYGGTGAIRAQLHYSSDRWVCPERPTGRLVPWCLLAVVLLEGIMVHLCYGPWVEL